MCKKRFDNCPFMLEYCIGRYKTHKMCKKAVDSYQLTFSYVPDWFVAPKKFEVLGNNKLDYEC